MDNEHHQSQFARRSTSAWNSDIIHEHVPLVELSSDQQSTSEVDTHSSEVTLVYGARTSIHLTALLPGLFVALSSAGLATALLVWLLTRRVSDHIPAQDHYFTRALVAVEGSSGPKLGDDGTVTADTTMYGLAISSMAGVVISISTPFLVGVFGYWIAATWLRDQEQQQLHRLPTPAQYGLLVRLCGSSNWMSVYETTQYLRLGITRPKVPPSLLLTFTVLVVSLVLTHGLAVADLWLHTTARTFLYTSLAPLSVNALPPVGSRINTNICPGPFIDSTLVNYTSCARKISKDPSNYAQFLDEGLKVIGNTSRNAQSVFLENIAMLVPMSIPTELNNVVHNTFGLNAECQPVTNCGFDNGTFLCPSFNPPYTGQGVNSISSVDEYNLTDNFVPNGNTGTYALDSTLNPGGVRIILSDGFNNSQIEFANLLTKLPPGWYRPDPQALGVIYVSVCRVTAYNISLSFSSSGSSVSYVLAGDPVLSNFNTTSALFTAFDDVFGSSLANYLALELQPYYNESTDAFNSNISKATSMAAMGLASPLFEREKALTGQSVSTRIASRYPLAPLCTVFGILYTYALLSILICICSNRLSSKEVVVDDANHDLKDKQMGSRPVTAVELAQLRLVNPLAAIAERFADGSPLVETSALDIFHEHLDAERLGVGIVPTASRVSNNGLPRSRHSFQVAPLREDIT